jgi:hypothetical protein
MNRRDSKLRATAQGLIRSGAEGLACDRLSGSTPEWATDQ